MNRFVAANDSVALHVATSSAGYCGDCCKRNNWYIHVRETMYAYTVYIRIRWPVSDTDPRTHSVLNLTPLSANHSILLWCYSALSGVDWKQDLRMGDQKRKKSWNCRTWKWRTTETRPENGGQA